MGRAKRNPSRCGTGQRWLSLRSTHPTSGKPDKITCAEKLIFVRLSTCSPCSRGSVENNSLFQKIKSGVCLRPSRPARGALRPIVTKRAAGCDGRDMRKDEAQGAYGEIVWSRSPDAGIKSAGDEPAGDGG